jgi:hypothetical protein
MAKDPREYGYEGEMVMSQLKGIMSHAEQLHGRLKPDTDLPEWVQSKITLAYDYMQTAADYMSTEMSEEVKAGKAYKVPVKPAQAWPGGKVYKQKPVDSKKLDAVGKKIGAIRGVKEEAQLDENQKPLGKHIGTVNGYHIHDLGVDTPHQNKRFLAYHNTYSFISHTAPTKTEITKKSKEHEKSKPAPKRTEHDDWRDSMKHRIQSGEIRRAVMSRRGVREDTQLDELSKDTLKSYVNKADARTMDRVIDDPKARRKAQNRTFGIEKAVKKIQEDGAVNAAGAGNVAGIGVGPQGEPGVHMKKKKKTVIASFKRFTGK